jgi:hypothetical protein
MDLGQVLQKASVACFNSGQRGEDHFVEGTKMTPRNRQLGPRRRNVKCVAVSLVSPRHFVPPYRAKGLLPTGDNR